MRSRSSTTSSFIRGASPLGLPYTLSRAAFRRRAPFAWLTRCRSFADRRLRPVNASQLMKYALLIAAATSLFACDRGPSFDRRADQNILLITIDTLRADALSSYDNSHAARTPNLDGLAARGTRFDFAHAHSVLTRPSHASILTGLYPFVHGVRDHSGYRMQRGTATLATLLKANGFATGAFVGGMPLARDFGLDAGFDVYDDRFARPGQASDFTLAERPAGEVVDAALKWIAEREGRGVGG